MKTDMLEEQIKEIIADSTLERARAVALRRRAKYGCGPVIACGVGIGRNCG
jgi:hypothetical protein